MLDKPWCVSTQEWALLFRVCASPCVLGSNGSCTEERKSSNNSKALLVSYLQLFGIFSCVTFYSANNCVN